MSFRHKAQGRDDSNGHVLVASSGWGAAAARERQRFGEPHPEIDQPQATDTAPDVMVMEDRVQGAEIVHEKVFVPHGGPRNQDQKQTGFQRQQDQQHLPEAVPGCNSPCGGQGLLRGVAGGRGFDRRRCGSQCCGHRLP